MENTKIFAGRRRKFLDSSRLILVIIILFAGQLKLEAQTQNVIPRPTSVDLQSGTFVPDKSTVIYYKKAAHRWLANYLDSAISNLSGFDVRTKTGAAPESGIKVITLNVDETATIPEEGYQLRVAKNEVFIKAKSTKGLFYGIQTLLQLVPVSGPKIIPCVMIEDAPRFKWRGVMLDVSRHFFTVDEVKKLIDQMAMYKFNILHLHLTDDQGWRIEIKALPQLTEIGSRRVPRTGLWWEREPPRDGEERSYAGFYTQDDIKEILHYAASRQIQVLPEIDVPGHSLAAIAAFPMLSSTKLQYHVNPGSKFYAIEDNALCPGQEATFEFLEKVFTEIAGLFPFEYIHVGGDECYKGFWKKCTDCQRRIKENNLKDENELQSYFIKRLVKILASRGKKLIGWDEIIEGGLAPDATVMSWRGMAGGIAAAKEHHRVVMSPTNHAYLDLYQGDPAIEPPTYNMLRLKDVYSFEPEPVEVDSKYILGGQGNLWTESVPTWHHAEYMLWPRLLALAEVLWSPKQTKSWQDFMRRTEYHFQRMEVAGINYASSVFDAIIQPSKDEKGKLKIKLDTEIEGLSLYYTFDNTYPDRHASLYRKGEELTIPNDAETFRVVTYRKDKVAGRIITVALSELEKRCGK